jgi:DNA-directed RNA polymerase specialized sigma24 family protein
MSPGPSDEQLMRQFYECDEGAFQELARRWFPQLVRYFRRRGCSPADAGGLAQDVLVKLWQTKVKTKQSRQ